MFRLFIGPIIIGVLAFLCVYFVSPVIISDSGIVSIVGDLVLKLSNLHFESLPPIISSYITNLNLAMAALTVGLLMTIVIQLLVIIWGILSYMTKWIISCLRRDRSEDEPQDLPPIDMDPGFKPSSVGKGVVGRGLDSIDQN